MLFLREAVRVAHLMKAACRGPEMGRGTGSACPVLLPSGLRRPCASGLREDCGAQEVVGLNVGDYLLEFGLRRVYGKGARSARAARSRWSQLWGFPRGLSRGWQGYGARRRAILAPRER